MVTGAPGPAADSSTTDGTVRTKRVTARPFVIALAAFAVLAIASVFVVPPIARSQMDKAFAQLFTEPPSIGKIRFNPLTFTLGIEQFRLPARSDSILTFDRLRISFDVFSAFRGAWTFRAIELDRPVLRLRLASDGSLNLARMFKPVPPAPPGKRSKPPQLRFLSVALRQGRIDWTDETRTPALATQLDTLNFLLTDFRTRKGSNSEYTLEAETPQGEQLAWRGRLALDPLTSAGRFRIGQLKARTLEKFLAGVVPFHFATGEADFGAHYAFDATTTPVFFRIDSLATDLRDLALVDLVDDSAGIGVRVGSTRGGSIEPRKAIANLGTVSMDGLRASMAILPNGHLDLERWGQPVPGAPRDTAPAVPWTVNAANLDAREVAVTIRDTRLRKPARFHIDHGMVTMTNFTSATGTTFPVTVACSTGEGGTAKGEGTMGVMPPTADLHLDLQGFDLRVIQPYIDAFAKLELTSGTVEGDGRFQFSPNGTKGPLVRFVGEATSRNLKTRDRELKQNFMTWTSLRLHGLSAELMPTKVTIKEIVAGQPYIRSVVAPDRTTNFQVVLTPPGPLPPAFATASTDTPEVRIDKVVVRDGSAWFADLSLEPNFSTAIQQLEGTIVGLSSIQQTGGQVQLAGKVDRYAPVAITGTIDPLGGAGRTDVSVKFQHIELTTFTPYSGKFAGYRVRKGKLSLDLRYEVVGRYLKGENKILLEQLTLGEKVESPDATKLPVRFAIALLKDKNGNIDLDIPVKGDLNDPKFSFMRVILKVLVNLLVKAVSSPFKLIGLLVGGGEESSLDAVEFDPGSAALVTTGVIDQLAKALSERPGLHLEIEEKPDVARDSVALAQQRYEQILTASMTEADRHSAASPIRLPSPEYAALVERAYTKQFGPLPRDKTKRGKGAAADSAAFAAAAMRLAGMEQKLRESVVVTEAEIAALARQRAVAIKERLVATGGVGEERLFIVTQANGQLDGEVTAAQLAEADSLAAAADSAAVAAKPRGRDESRVWVRLSLIPE